MTLDFYNQYAKEYFFQTVKADVSSNYEKFLPYIKKEGFILDLGCGSGRDSYYFKQQGYHVVAVDGSKELAKQASVLLGQPVINQLFNEMNFKEEFDGVWACASLLHISIDEIPSILEKIRTSLKQDGIFYISVKEGNGSLIEKDGRFFQYYSKTQLKKIIDECAGLEVEALWRNSELRNGDEEVIWLNVLGRKVK